jgi:hypothetical protein
MKSIKLLLVGDIHYPDVKSALAIADYKDTAYPSDLAKISIPDKLQNVAREISRLRDDDECIAGILLCGDLTTHGDLDGYRDCVKYLNEALRLSDSTIWRNEHVHIVPGNHDVDRKLCDGSDFFQKFIPLVEAWSGPPQRDFTAKGSRHTVIEKNGIGAAIFSLNSCVGCGEKRFLPEKVREDLSGILSKAFREDSINGFDLVGVQLDTPAFVEGDISNVVTAIGQMGQNYLPIVLAHHNILPQAAPRIALYTEAINGGLVRSRLTHCLSPVIYCHGHIHTDPIEIIQTASGNGSSVVSLSIPPLIDGFDVLEVHFGHKDFPVGCTIHRHRVQSDGGVLCIQEKDVRVPVHSGKLHDHMDDRMIAILKSVKHDKYLRFDALITPIHRKFRKQFSENAIAKYLLEAEWLGLVEILNREEQPKVWQVRKTQP